MTPDELIAALEAATPEQLARLGRIVDAARIERILADRAILGDTISLHKYAETRQILLGSRGKSVAVKDEVVPFNPATGQLG